MDHFSNFAAVLESPCYVKRAKSLHQHWTRVRQCPIKHSLAPAVMVVIRTCTFCCPPHHHKDWCTLQTQEWALEIPQRLLSITLTSHSFIGTLKNISAHTVSWVAHGSCYVQQSLKIGQQLTVSKLDKYHFGLCTGVEKLWFAVVCKCTHANNT